MAQSQQNVFKSIQTILVHLPPFFPYYSPREQEILNDFLISLQSIEPHSDRSQIHYTLAIFLTKYAEYYFTEELSCLTFLKFAHGFISLSLDILQAQGKYLTSFFNFILKSLRDIFKLLQQGTSLSDNIWNDVYSSCIQLDNPLTDEELRLINTLTRIYFGDKGYTSLNRIFLLKFLRDQGVHSKIDFFNKFTTQMQSKVTIHFFPQAFDLTPIFFKCSLHKPLNFDQIIDLSDPKNTTLLLSTIYRIPDQNSNFPVYQGVLIIPVGFYRHLERLFHKLQNQNILQHFNLDVISNYRWSRSFSLYKSNLGWSRTSIHNWYKFITGQITKKEVTKKENLYFVTPSFQNNRTYKTFFYFKREKLKAIKLFCKASNSFSLSNLPGNYKRRHKTTALFDTDDKRIFKTFFINTIARTVFSPQRILNLSPLDQYLISTQISFIKFSPILQFFPASAIIFTKNSYHLIATIPSETALQISQDLNWDITPIRTYFQPSQPDYSWFDPNSLQWNPPHVFLDETTQ